MTLCLDAFFFAWGLNFFCFWYEYFIIKSKYRGIKKKRVLNSTPKVQSTKGKTAKFNFTKTEKSAFQRPCSDNEKVSYRVGEILANYLSNKGQILKIQH